MQLLRTIALLAMIFLASAAPRAQEPTPAATPSEKQQPRKQVPGQAKPEDATLRISTALVQTDVTVLDKQGRFVDGLPREQFEVKVNGKPQAISFFDRITAGAAEEDAKLSAARGNVPKAGSAPKPAERGASIIFFVDDFHLTAERMNRARQIVLTYVNQDMRSTDQAMIASASGQPGFLQQFTASPEVLRAAAARLKFNSLARLDTERPPMSVYEAYSIDAGRPDVLEHKVLEMRATRLFGSAPPEQMRNQIRLRARTLLSQNRQINLALIASLETLLRNSTAVPGRKLLFFISEGFIPDQRNQEVARRIEHLLDAAARAGVVFYTVDARGLTPGTPEAESDAFASLVHESTSIHTPASATDIALGEASETITSLRGLAYDTGGRPIINTNALEKAVGQALDEYRNYYLLAWQPDEFEPGKTKFRRIEVRVKDRPELRVLVRRGFFDAPPAPVEKKTDDKADKAAKAKDKPDPETAIAPAVAEAMRALTPTADLPLALYAAFRNDAERGSFLDTTIELPPDAFAAESGGERRNAEVELIYLVLDANGKVAANGGKKLSLADGAVVREGKLVSQFVIPTPAAGIYQLRVAARNMVTGKVGTRFEWIEAPEFKPNKLALSSLLLSERRARNAEAPALNVERRFARSSRLLLQLYLYNAARQSTAPPDVMLEIDVLNREKSILNAPSHPVATAEAADLGRILYSAEIPLRGLSPGLYTLRVKAADRIGKTEEVRSVNFIVE
jgi:VWFA-related protein